MATKDSGNVTITLNRTTVEMLRAKKKDLETWDELMLRLGRKRQFEIECVFCGAVIKTKNVNTTEVALAGEYGWKMMYSGRVDLIEQDEIETTVELGYVCPECGARHSGDAQ